MRSEALKLAAFGFAVFQTEGKIPLPGTHGHLDATTSPPADWWPEESSRNVAISLDKTKGPDGRIPFGIDLDVRYNGIWEWVRFIAGREVPDTVRVQTGTGGYHFYFYAPVGWAKFPKGLGKGIDVKQAGYLIAPPSLHPETKEPYRWESEPWSTPIADAPQWLLDEMAKACGPSSTTPLHPNPAPDYFVSGERNNMLTSLAGTMRRRGMRANAIDAALQVENIERCRPPLDAREVRRIAESAERNMDAAEPVVPGTNPVSTESALTIADVLKQWRDEGPLVHEPTGIARLDELTGGGPVYGYRWYLVGAPDAGKTALFTQIAHEFAKRGVCVGFLAVDEEPTDILMRLAQRTNHLRFECETRSADILRSIGETLSGLPFEMYPANMTIEKCAEALAAKAQARGMRAALFVDSIQTALCELDKLATKEMSERAAVTARAYAIRASATKHRMIIVATSEMNRSAYRSIEAAEKSNDMAAAAESRVVEYSARVMMALRSVADAPDTLELKVVKNKHGRSNEKIFLKLDRTHQRLAETKEPEPSGAEGDSHKVRSDASSLLKVILRHPGKGTMELRVKSGLGAMSLERALERLLEENKIENRPEKKGLREYPHFWPVSFIEDASDA